MLEPWNFNDRIKNEMNPRTTFVLKVSFCLLLFWTEALQGQEVHTSPQCANGFQSYRLQWGNSTGQNAWPIGSLQNDFLNADGSGHDIKITVSGDSDHLGILGAVATPHVSPTYAAGQANLLHLFVNPPNNTTSEQKINLQFFPPINAQVAFDLYNIGLVNERGSKLKVAAHAIDGTTIYPIFENNGSPSWSSNTQGEVWSNSDEKDNNNDQVGVVFNSNQRIERITIDWTTCAGCRFGDRGIGLGSLDFCTMGPDYDRDGVPDLMDIDDDNDGLPDPLEVCALKSDLPSPTETEIRVDIKFDDFPDDVSWTLKNSDDEIVMSGDNYDRLSLRREKISIAKTLPIDDYTFKISDRYDDGICCVVGNGYYEIRIDGHKVVGTAGNGDFGASATEQFNSGDLPLSAFTCLGWDPADDHDKDGIPNYKDADFCTLNAKGVCIDMDTDSDGVPDFFDLDSDNDGIPDLIESGKVDQDGNGQADDLTDIDKDGLADIWDNNITDGPGGSAPCVDAPYCLFQQNQAISLMDTDADGIPNTIDLDSDNDGLTDRVEALVLSGVNSNANYGFMGLNVLYDPFWNGTPLMTTSVDDSDENTRVEYNEVGLDQDKDDVPNFMDIDSDNDGLFDYFEAQSSSSFISRSAADADQDGLLDAYDDKVGFGGKGIDLNPLTTAIELYNHDQDAWPCYLDSDSDNDNTLDLQEAWDDLYDGDSRPDHAPQCTGIDVDGDGLSNCFDANDSDINNKDWLPGILARLPIVTGSGNPLAELFPDNGGNDSEPDLRDPVVDCSVPRVNYALSQTTIGYDDGSGQHEVQNEPTEVRATAFCQPDGEDWCYFFNPADPSNYLFAIKDAQGSPNVVPMNELVDYIEIKIASDPTDRFVEDGSGATLVMGRDWNVELKATPSPGSTFDIKFYFPPSDMQALSDKANEILTKYPSAEMLPIRWFKKPGGLEESDISSTGIETETNISHLARFDFDLASGVPIIANQINSEGDSSPAGDGKNYIEFNGLTGFSGGTALIQINFAPLPVELSFFDGEADGCEGYLSWYTEEEVNFSHFEIQRSFDGKVFKTIGEKEPNLGRVYQFRDRAAGDENYYRLKMIDLDGTFAYSSIVAIETPCKTVQSGFSVSPNPINGNKEELSVRVYSKKEKIILSLYDVAGVQYFSRSILVSPGWNIVDLQLPELMPGIYYLVNEFSVETQVEKLVVTEDY